MFQNLLLENKHLNPKIDVTTPCDKCNGDCCGSIPLKKKFVKDMFKKYNLNKIVGSFSKAKYTKSPIPEHFNFVNKEGNCVFKTVSGCLIYKDRPTICKAYGETSLVRCPYENLTEQPKDPKLKKELVIENQKRTHQKMVELYERLGV